MELIAAADENWAIGNHGQLLTHLPGDLRFFKQLTNGHTLLVGRKTLESFPNGKPLPNRTHIVLTHNPSYEKEGVHVCHSYDEALSVIQKMHPARVFVAGGSEIYKTFLNDCTVCYITKIHAALPADAHMPCLDEDPSWQLVKQGPPVEENGYQYSFLEYHKKEDQ